MLFKGHISQKTLLKLSDEDLIQEYQMNENKQILSEIYNRYGYMVYGVCLKFYRNKEDAEDQTILIFSLLKSKIKDHQILNFRGWLHTLTRNECLMEIRKRKVKQNNHPIIEIPNDEMDLDGRLATEKWLNMLPELTLQLNEMQGKCVNLFYFQDESYQVISEMLNISLNEVKSHIQNGKRNLRIKITQLKNENE